MRLPSRFTPLAATLLVTAGLMTGVGTPAAATEVPASGASASGVSASGVSVVGARKARTTNPPTPGTFTGYGFDQCLAPTQASMDAWLEHSPFLAVGIYISGDSRACRTQPHLTPTWVSNQLAKGWRLLPIALGPQASCQPRFPRYKDDFKIDPRPGANKLYSTARSQGAAEADKNAADARALGLAPGSTVFYDLEGFTYTDTHCRESALAFVSAWTERIEALGFVSGLYSSASSGIAMVDEARRNRPGQYRLPQQIWIARWDGVANTSTTYIGEDGWRPGGRLKQYRGDHNETWGGVTINIDSNWLELGAAPATARESRCGGVRTTFGRYFKLTVKKANRARTRALQCALTETGHYTRPVNGRFTWRTRQAAKAWEASAGLPVKGRFFNRRHWTALHAQGDRPLLKVGSSGPAVYRVQRALNARISAKLKGTGIYDQATESAMRTYQSRRGLPASGITNAATWSALQSGR